MSNLPFEWDPAKNRANQARHGISFEEASELFSSGEDYLEIYDELHSTDEDRFIAVGPIAGGIVVVVYTERLEDLIRILSARTATRNEQEQYRNYWLEYAWKWIRRTAPNGYLQMPGARILADPANETHWYWAHTPSQKVPKAFDQEETIKRIWSSH